MKIKKTHFIILMHFLISGIYAVDKEIFLPDVQTPWLIAVDDNQLYVSERHAVYFYSLDDFILKKKSGQRGQGPGDFVFILDMYAGGEELVITDAKRLHFYSKAGEYIREFKSQAFCTRFIPIANRFVGTDTHKENGKTYYTINIFDVSGTLLQKKDEIYKYEGNLQGKGIIDPIIPDPIYYTENGVILMNGIDDYFYIFQQNGSPLRKISLPYEKTKVTKKYKNDYFNRMKKHPRLSMVYEMYKDRLEMPEYFPFIRFYCADKMYIYIITYQVKDGKTLCIVIDYFGKEIEKTWIYLEFQDFTTPYPFDIRNGTLYQLSDDLEKESWKLSVTKLMK